MVPLSPAVERIVDAIYSPQRQAIAAQLAALEIRIFFAGAALQLALLFGYFYSGAAAWVRGALERRLRAPLATAAAFVTLTYAGYALALLPLDWFAGFTVPHAYGLSRELPATWFHDWAVGNAVNLAVVLLVTLAFGRSVRRFGKRWPLAAAIAAAPLIVFANAIYPAYVAPLFNKYTPMPPSPITSSILSLAAREGIDAKAVFEYDMSRQTTEGNAYVAGIGPTARIAIGDNLIRDMKPDELLYIVAHEMGHYKMGHIWWGSLYGWFGTVAAILFAAFAGGAAVRAAGPRFGRGIDDPAALPLLAALLLCFALVTAPTANGVSRGIEQAADDFARSQTNLGKAGIRAFARLGSEDLSVLHPQPLVVWYFYTHPPLDERITYAVAR
jgi:Zn-dependent protease with chaperone function